MKLDELRQELDAVDAKLLQQFQQRMALAESIAQVKKEQSLPILDSAREQEKLTLLASQAEPNNKEAVQELFLFLFRLSRERQASVTEASES